MKPIKYAIFPFLVLWTMLPAFSQQKTFRISGKVVDAETNAPLQNVGIQLYGTLQGTATDKDGTFDISYNEKHNILSISLVGYEKKKIYLDENIQPQIVIPLYQLRDTLQKITIESDRNREEKQLPNSIVDYSFYGDHLLIVSHINYLPKLVLSNSNLDTLSQLNIPKKPVGLFLDCLGYNHLLYKDESYQIFYGYDKLQIIYPSPIENLQNMLYNCEAADEKNLYLTSKKGVQIIETEDFKFESHNHEKNFVSVNRQTKQKSSFLNIRDVKNIRLSHDGADWITRKSYMLKYNQRTGSHSMGMFGTAFSMDMDKIFNGTIIFKEIFAPIYVIEGKTYVFDYVHSKILHYNLGLPEKEVKINFHQEKNWQPEMCIDKKRNTIYAIYEKHGTSSLKSIDLENGNLHGAHEIPYPFVSHISVHDNFIYFLRNIGNFGNDIVLSRQEIN